MIRYAIIPFIIVAVFFLKIKRGVSWSNPAVMLAFIYFFSCFSSLFVTDDMLLDFDVDQHSLTSYCIYGLLVVVCLLPVFHLKRLDLDLASLELSPPVMLFIKGFSLAAWYAFVYLLPFALTAVTTGATEVRQNLAVERSSVLPETVLTTIAVAVAMFYVVYTALFFAMLQKPLHWLYKVSLFLGSTLYVLASLCFTGRDGVVFFVLTYVFFYFLFKDSLVDAYRKRVRFFMTLVIGSFLPLLIVFTLQRFGDSGGESNNRLLVGTLGYIGQQPYVFAETIERQIHFYEGNLRFPLIQQAFFDYKEIVRTEVYEWSFGTFLTDFYTVQGWISLFLLSLLLFVFFYRGLRPARAENPYAYLLLLCFYFQFISQGVFYFRLGMRAGNIYIVLVLLLYYIAKRVSVYRISHDV
jgi:oligosaccharide repeat unit polymerase